MASFPEKQKRMREEINKHIADDDVPNLGHRANCHYTTAFIAETLRFR
jgi:cytochrome P450